MMDVVQIFPANLQKLWNALELRLLVLLSLFLQVVLISTGNRRKYTKKKRVAAVLWLSYLSADSVATLALGVLSQAQGDTKHVDPSYTIMALWAPFLLMHLGGPDTITAYALADNELWSRHLLGLAGQVIVAVYVFFRSFTGASMNFLWLVIFFAGVVKYGERSWVLFSASKDRFRDSLVSRPDPGPNYAKFMNELVSREHEGYRVSLGKAIDTVSSSSSTTLVHPAANAAEGIFQDSTVLHEAYYFFGTFKRLFADLILSFQDRENSFAFFNSDIMDAEKAFKIIEIELGFVYDLFYTKSFLLYSPIGLFLRAFSCSSTIAAFVAFLIIDKNVFPKTEVIITYFLLVGAIFLEIYAVMILFSSDMMMIWLTGDWITLPKLVRKFRNPIVFSVDKIVSWLLYLHVVPARMRWSNSMGQYNVLNCCLESKPKCTIVHQYLEKYLFWKSEGVPDGLKALIFNELKERAKSSDKKLGSSWFDKILIEEMNYFAEEDKNHDIQHEVEFDQSLLLWHMATDFCYYTDVNEKQKTDENVDSSDGGNGESSSKGELKFRREICKLVSNYMMHLLIKSPFMLPSGIGQIRFQDTRAEATEFFNEQELSEKKACEMLCEVDTRYAPSEVKGDRSKSLLFDACRLAKSLKSLEVGQRWEKITQAWLDILTFAAAQCSWSDHAEKLSQGGELLTHVWLLMAHFGMTDQFQISQGYIRAKLNLK